jgi:ribosome-binding protein aMBF1 (putative translation factor)
MRFRCERCGRKKETFHVAVNGNDYNLCKPCCLAESKEGKRVTLMEPKGIDLSPEIVVFS